MKNIFSKEYWDQRDVELYIGKVLRYGVIISCTITIIGGFFYLYQHGSSMPNYAPIQENNQFQGVAQYLREFSSIFPRIFSLDGAAIIQFGVCVLIATPIIRVMFSAFSFLIEKDYMYVVITLIVLVVILSNMFLGFH